MITHLKSGYRCSNGPAICNCVLQSAIGEHCSIGTQAIFSTPMTAICNWGTLQTGDSVEFCNASLQNGVAPDCSAFRMVTICNASLQNGEVSDCSAKKKRCNLQCAIADCRLEGIPTKKAKKTLSTRMRILLYKVPARPKAFGLRPKAFGWPSAGRPSAEGLRPAFGWPGSQNRVSSALRMLPLCFSFFFCPPLSYHRQVALVIFVTYTCALL